MFKNMKLSMKLVLGFATVIAIAVLIGGIGVYNINAVYRIAETMEQETVPAATVANNVERTALMMRYSVLGYTISTEENRLESCRQGIVQLQDYLSEATKLANEHGLDWLTTNAREATVATTEYEQEMGKMVNAIANMKKEEDASVANAKRFMDACVAYIAATERKIEELAKNPDARAHEVLDLNRQVTVVNNIIDEGNEIIIGTWYAIANRSPEHFLQTQKRFATIDRHLDELRTMTNNPDDLQLIKQSAEAGQAYLQNMNRFLEAWYARENVLAQLVEIGVKVTDAAQNTAEFAMKETSEGALDAENSLEKATWIVIVGLSIGAVAGIVIAMVITRGIAKPINQIIAGLTEGASQVASASEQVSA
ncbi:MAG TPA: hypothetical protein ENN97_09870, partial [Phycisphaerales bacterium]|nr:hypothetical protein [Phycisphaerales bacterium]